MGTKPTFTSVLAQLAVGVWMTGHYRARQKAAGTHVVAKQLRKQGVPLSVALAILVPGATVRPDV